MTADEIRKVTLSARMGALASPENSDILEFNAAMLQEIAAQLAELNALLRDNSKGINVILCSSNDSIPVRIMDR